MFKGKIKLIQKKERVEGFNEYVFQLPEDVDYQPGQFANISVTPPFKRPYSIVDLKERKITFIIDVRSPGKGADYFRNVQVGEETDAMLPLGRFTLKDTPNNKAFIATASGIAPFIPIFHQLKQQNFSGNIKLYFGIRYLRQDPLATDYISEFVDDFNFDYIRCISQPEGEYLEFEFGRVTHVVPAQNLNWKDTDFYLCGSNEMVKEMRHILIEKGADKIHVENYG